MKEDKGRLSTVHTWVSTQGLCWTLPEPTRMRLAGSAGCDLAAQSLRIEKMILIKPAFYAMAEMKVRQVWELSLERPPAGNP